MTGSLLATEALTEAHRAAMFTLLDAHFEGVTRAQFEADLRRKNWVVLLNDGPALLGFSTLLIRPAKVDGESFVAVYSGDTIVAPAAWNSFAFPRAWIHAVYSLRARFPDGRFIWLLLTSGYRTYRFLPVFWREFYPRVGVITPELWTTRLRELASKEYGPQFDPSSSIVRLANPQRLRGAANQIPEGRTKDPHVAFFLERNPGHTNGDELVCIADLSPENLTAAGRRIVYGAGG